MGTFTLKNSYLHGLSTFVPLPVPRLCFLTCFGTNTSKVLVFPRKGSDVISVSDKHLMKMRNYAVESKREALLQTQMEDWEDPDDGSGSEYDDDEAVGENDLDFESDWEEASSGIDSIVSGDKATTVSKYEEDLIKVIAEVEQLLGPEERAILAQNATPNLGKISTEKWKALQTLSLSMQIPYMDKLLDNGLDIDSVDKDGLTALHKAIIGKKEAVISHLLRKGANPIVKDKDGASPLHYAVQVGAMQTVKLLIKYEEGWTPLHIAIQCRNRDVAKVLLINGADKTRKTKDGKTALDMSLCYGRDFKSYDLAKLLKILPVE